jgi:NAD(P)H dehydrogenase (quinone)
MRVLVVVANPDPNSYSHAISERVERGLRSAGHDVVVRDLCAEQFRAAMSAEERVAYHSDTPVLDPMVQDHIDDLLSAQGIVFVYPTWWSSLPAVLKGWLERVMVPGVGFVLDDQHRVRPGLTGLRRIAGVSTYGSPLPYVKAVNDNGRRTITRALRMSAGWRARTTWLGLYALDTRTDAERAAFLDRVESTMAGWR